MISVQNFSKKYNDTVYENTCIDIEDNKITFIMGANGSGKTTFIKCLLNLEKYLGEILFDKMPFSCIQGNIFVIYDDAPFYDNLTGLKNIKILTQTNPRKKLEEINNQLSIDILRKPVKTYSYGQRKKLALIIAEIKKPKYFILDEISNGLDFDSVVDLQAYLKNLSKNTTIILMGHQFDFYAPIVDNVYYIRNKKFSEKINFDNCEKTLKDIYYENIKKH